MFRANENEYSSEVLANLAGILPTLAANAAETEAQRWVVQENLDLLQDAGVFSMTVPKVYGGLESSLGEQVAVYSAIASACPSTGWTCGLWAGGTFAATRFPDAARAEIFTSPSTRASGVFTPTGTLTPVDGGYLLNGAWRWNTGSRGAHWDGLGARLEHPDGRPPTITYAMVPMAELTIVDDWHAYGASGTGSSQTTAVDVFVPAHRVLNVEDLLANDLPTGTEIAKGRNYAVMPYVVTSLIGVFIGIARGALDSFLARLPGRGVTYTSWTDQRQHPGTQVRVANAVAALDAADALTARIVEKIQAAADEERDLNLADRAYVRGVVGYIVRICRETVESLHGAAGASVIMRDVPVQRYFRDIESLALHAHMNSDINAEIFGRVLLGLDPDTAL